MKKAILAKKVGMTQIFDENGVLTPVTVLQAGPCVVTQIKTVENDGYDAIQVGFGEKKERVTTKDVSGKKVIRNPHGAGKAEVGHAKKAGTTPKAFYREFRLENTAEYELGAEIKADVFAAGDKIDVTAKSKGKGFAGTIKRYNHARLRMTHGVSACHREVGSLGAIKGNLKGKKLPGHMGSETVTLQNLTIAKVDADRELILIRGNVPGPKKGFVVIKTAVKAVK